MSKVSVIIPLYNQKQYVGEAIESVLSQTYPNIEIIVVNDGSKDNPENILEKYAEKIILINQENKGLAAARNTGIKESQGTYLVFLDSDDYLDPDKIKTEVEVLAECPDIDWVYESSLVIDENKRVVRKLPNDALQSSQQPPEGYIFESLVLKNFMPVNATMMRRKVFDVGTFDESLTSYEDWDFWLRVSAKHKVKYIDKILAFVRFHPGSMQSDQVKFYSNKIRVIRKACTLYRSLAYPKRYTMRKNLFHAHIKLGRGYFKRKEFKKCVIEHIRAIIDDPFLKRDAS